MRAHTEKIARGIAMVASTALTWGFATHGLCAERSLVERQSLAAATSPVEVAIGPVTGIITDSAGAVYFSSKSIVYRLDAAGTLARVAGNGTAGYSGDGGPAASAQLDIPFDDYAEIKADFIDFGPLVGPLAVDATGNLFIGDAYNNRIRRVDSAGIISTVAGDGPPGYPYGGNPLVAWPQGIAFDRRGNLYIAGAFGSLSRMTQDGQITQLAGGDCGAGFQGPGLCVPEQIAIDSAGNVYVPDGYCRVRKVTPDGSVVTVAGNETPSQYFVFTCGYSGDGGPAIGATLSNQPFAVAVDASNNLYIADTYNHCIRKVDTSGVITTFAGECGQHGFGGDGGPAIAALLNSPFGVTMDANGNMYIADTYNFRVRKVGTDGRISTVAGNGNSLPDVLGAVAAPTGMVAIGPGFTGSWYNPSRSGQGLSIEVLPGGRFYTAWFAFDPTGAQAWISGVGTYSGNAATIAAVVQPTGGRWTPNLDASQIVLSAWGTLTFTFSDCNNGHVEWVSTVPGYGSGGMDLSRLTLPAGLTCP